MKCMHCGIYEPKDNRRYCYYCIKAAHRIIEDK